MEVVEIFVEGWFVGVIEDVLETVLVVAVKNFFRPKGNDLEVGKLKVPLRIFMDDEISQLIHLLFLNLLVGHPSHFEQFHQALLHQFVDAFVGL